MVADVLTPLDRELIGALGLNLTSIQRSERMPGGIGGARLLRLTVEHRTGAATWRERLLMKVLLPDDGWLGVASGDSHLREVQLWRHGLLQSLPAGIATGVKSWALLGDPEHPTAGALLMDDLTARLLRDPYHPPPGRRPSSLATLLERLAALHARYWQGARLSDSALGLLSARDALLLISPETVKTRRAAGDDNSYLPLAEYGWEAFFRLAPPSSAEQLHALFANPDLIMSVITQLPRTLVHGDVWGPNLGWLPPLDRSPRRGQQLLLLDWALTLAGPATYDPLWLCGGWQSLDPRRVMACYRVFLQRRLRARGVTLTPATWLALLDAGYLRTALTCGEAFGRAAEEVPAGRAREVAGARVHWWAERAVLAANRLLAGYLSGSVSA